MIDFQISINDLNVFMQTEVYVSLDETTKAMLVRKKTELCGLHFLQMAANLKRFKTGGCYAPHKAVMILAVMELVESGYISSNVVRLDKALKEKFREVWCHVVPPGCQFLPGYDKPFKHMNQEPFWSLSADKNIAFLTAEAFFAFSHEESRSSIRTFLLRSIREDSIRPPYRNAEAQSDWNVAEGVLGILPAIGFLMAI